MAFGIVRSGFVHQGAARTLVHRLKYDAVHGAADVLAAEGMAHLVPPGARTLVPVPRTTWRAARYGVDPALVLARRLAALTGVPVSPLLRPSLYAKRHAGRTLDQRAAPRFWLERPTASDVVLVDDVITTGVTLQAAAAVLGAVVAAVTATVSV